jgi:hypothetical protein
MHKKTKSHEPGEAEVIPDFLQTSDELAAIDRSWLEEVQRRSAEFDAGRMDSRPAEEVFERIRRRLRK